MSPELIVYAPETTNRTRYTFDLFFKESMRLPYKIVNNIDEFNSFDGAKICYGSQTMPDELCFGAVFLLFEKKIRKQEIEVLDYNGYKVFFKVEDEDYALPYDPFAAAFYLVSRYEEYLPCVKDMYGRYPAEESLAYKNDFLKTPVVNYYIDEVAEVLKEYFPDIKIERPKYSFTPTYDIDSAFAYKNKGLIRNIGGLFKSLFQGEYNIFSDRIKVYLGLKKDPFDTYDYLLSLHKKNDLEPVFFFLVGEYGEYDKNISIKITEFQSLIKSVDDFAKVGIHPSFASNEEPEKLSVEIAQLRKVLKREITRSRQHFLMLTFPKTYSQLIENDIQADYTMGYASDIGFRASICQPFYFYNLTLENKTKLLIYPFCIMDACLYYYLKYSPEQAILACRQIITEVQKVNGNLITLWHNNSLSDQNEWKGWVKVYEEVVKMALSK
ncbi:MAG: polysaccharide deacetylase family protein [Chitinophagales bacterium]